MTTRAIRTTDPAEEAITTAQAKIHLGIASTVTYHDAWLASEIKKAREDYEHDTQTCIITSTWTQSYVTWPSEIRLLVRPVTAITSIQYRDASGTLQTFASSNYWLDNTVAQPCIRWETNTTFPTLEDDNRPETVVVTYVAGYADADDVPADIKSDLLFRVQHSWQLKTQVNDNAMKPLERAIESMTRRRERSTYP